MGALVCAVDRLGVLNYYTQGMALLRADMNVLALTLEQHCPKVSKHFAANDVDMLSVCSEWFITWFAKSLPIPTLLRVWDALFFEGFKVLFRAAVGIFRRAEPEILRCDSFDDLMAQAKLWPQTQVQHNELLKASFAGSRRQPLRRRDLALARDDALYSVICEDKKQREHLEAVAAARGRAQAV